MITSRPIVPTAHRSLPRASLRRSWGALRAAHGALPWTAGTISASLDEETISSTLKPVSRVHLQ